MGTCVAAGGSAGGSAAGGSAAGGSAAGGSAAGGSAAGGSAAGGSAAGGSAAGGSAAGGSAAGGSAAGGSAAGGSAAGGSAAGGSAAGGSAAGGSAAGGSAAGGSAAGGSAAGGSAAGGSAAGGSAAGGSAAGGSAGGASFSVTVDVADVVMTWTLAVPSPRVKIVHKLGAAPSSVQDGNLSFDGAGSTARHPTRALTAGTMATPRIYTYALFACDASGATCTATGLTATLQLTVMQGLRGGGYVLYFRHAETIDQSQASDVCSDNLSLGYASAPTVPDWWKSCTPDVRVTPNWDCTGATARQLSAAGITQATVAGMNLTTRLIPFSRVLSSEMCRAVTSAQVMAIGPVELRPELTYYVYGNVQNRCNELRRHLTTTPDGGTNVALVSHSAITGDTGGIATIDTALCSVLDATGRGNAHVYKPLGDGGTLLVIDNVAPATWATLP